MCLGPFIPHSSQIAIWLIVWWHLCGSTCAQDSDWDAARRRLVENEIVGNGVTDKRVVDAMMRTPRHEFVPNAQRKRAYFDMALPIGNGQTISSPFIVAFMTQSLDPQPSDKVLEIGTGSGYQAAVLSPLVGQVYTIEIVEPLGRRAKRVLERLKYKNVQTKIGDGFAGWSEYAPYDKIIVTCSPEDVPQSLVQQLREGGRMVIPVGQRYQQTLYLLTKQNGKLVRESLRPTLFVPMTGEAESRRDVLPDPARPEVVNGSFEHAVDEDAHLPGWYYQRQASIETDELAAPRGKRFVHFTNETPGRGSHILQGLAIDGRQVERVTLSGFVKLTDVAQGSDAQMRPSFALTLYDERRRQLGHYFCGPWLGTREWDFVSKTFRVPNATREAILRVGLFGATGDFFVDEIRLEVGAPK